MQKQNTWKGKSRKPFLSEYSDIGKFLMNFLPVATLSGHNLATSRETNVKRQACKLLH